MIVHQLKECNADGKKAKCGSVTGSFTAWWRDVTCDTCIPAEIRSGWLSSLTPVRRAGERKKRKKLNPPVRRKRRKIR